jgi:hypothetical protein
MCNIQRLSLIFLRKRALRAPQQMDLSKNTHSLVEGCAAKANPTCQEYLERQQLRQKGWRKRSIGMWMSLQLSRRKKRRKRPSP